MCQAGSLRCVNIKQAQSANMSSLFGGNNHMFETTHIVFRFVFCLQKMNTPTQKFVFILGKIVA